MKKTATKDVRADIQRRVDEAKATIANAAEREGLAAQMQADQAAHTEHRNTPPAFPSQEWHDRALELHGAMTASHETLQKFDAAQTAASRVLRNEAPKLSAEADVKSLAKELATAIADAEDKQRRLTACVALIAADEQALGTLKGRQRAEIDEVADADVQARLDGKEAAVTKRRDSGLGAGIAEREAALEAARRLRNRVQTETTAMVDVTLDLHHRWQTARALASQLAFEQWQADSAHVVHEYLATQRACNRYPGNVEFAINEVDIQRIANEVAAECQPWRPAVTVANTEVAAATDDAESQAVA